MSLANGKTIADLVREMEKNDKNGETTSSKYVTTSMREDIDKTEAYINSKHISGDKDHLGRDKPFFNIVMSARNIWYRATDIDRKHISVRASKSTDVVKAFLATLKLQEWMKKVSFGKFLNDWGLTLATHGSAVTKFIEQDGKLHAQVVDWNNLICDQVDFENNPKIEKLWFTPAQLRKRKAYNQEFVEKLIANPTRRKTLDGQTKDSKDDYIPVYEVHGELPLSYITGKEKDEDVYVEQMHVISFQAEKDADSNTQYDDYTLFAGRESKDPYMITHLIKKDGQTYSGGAVKNLFEAQWMVNHSEKMIKDQLDLASKIVFQTADGAFVGKNVLSNIENGQIIKHAAGQPLTMLNNKPDIVAMQSFKADWQNIGNQINNISESLMGESAPSGTAWRQVQALLQESHSLFALMTENKGLAIIEMLKIHIIPFFKKKLNNSKEISMMLEEHHIKQIDSMYIPYEVTRRVNEEKKKTILSGRIYDPQQESADRASAEEAIKAMLRGNQRFIKPSDIEGVTWKEVFKDLEWDLDFDVTGESKDTQGVMATLTTILQTIVNNPQAMQDPTFKLIFNKIVALTGGISPLELQTTQAETVPLPVPGPGAPAGVPPELAGATVGEQPQPAGQLAQ